MNSDSKRAGLKKNQNYLFRMTEKNEKQPFKASAVDQTGQTEDRLAAAPGKEISDIARRALEEAAERRDAEKQADLKKKTIEEWNGPSGEEPTRYGDWERKGITYDF